MQKGGRMMLTQYDAHANHKDRKVRDEECAGIVAVLMELKYFDEQFVYYGTAYVENNRIKYRMHDKAEKMYQFFEKSAQKNLYPTEVIRYVQYKKVPSGKENDIAAEVRISLAEHLKEIYPKELFYLLRKTGVVPASNSAYPILLQWQDKLELCFEEDQIMLFVGVVKMAYKAKMIDTVALQQFLDWADDKTAQIASHTNLKWRKPHQMHGFLYWENGKLKSYVNALWYKVAERQYELLANKRLCTPIFSKTYWLDSMPTRDLLKWRDTFEKELPVLMDDTYCDYLHQIWNLPPTIDRAWYQELCSGIDVSQYPEAQKVLDYYGNIWRCS